MKKRSGAVETAATAMPAVIGVQHQANVVLLKAAVAAGAKPPLKKVPVVAIQLQKAHPKVAVKDLLRKEVRLKATLRKEVHQREPAKAAHARAVKLLPKTVAEAVVQQARKAHPARHRQLKGAVIPVVAAVAKLKEQYIADSAVPVFPERFFCLVTSIGTNSSHL